MYAWGASISDKLDDRGIHVEAHEFVRQGRHTSEENGVNISSLPGTCLR